LNIYFSSHLANFDLPDKRLVKTWIRFVLANEEKKLGEISFVFSSDNYILEVNKKYLNHDYFTDIITFNYNVGNVLNGDIVISLDTVRRNADFYKVEFQFELLRVIIHGILHLIGYDDKNDDDQKLMKEQEDRWLLCFQSKSFLKK
jgi:probable rRNA maturation factor